MKTFSFVLLGMAFATAIALADLAQSGRPAPQFSAPYAAGGNFKLSWLHGKPVYLNFYASWCAPCNEEAPDINALQKKYRKRGLTVLAVDEQESADRAQGFINKYRLTYRAVLDQHGDVLAPYGALGLPVHVFIDRRGTIKLVRNGEMSKTEIESAIRSIL